MRAEGFVPARPRRLYQPPWTQTINRKPRPTRMGANLQKNNQAYSQLLFGRGPGEALLLEKRPPPEFSPAVTPRMPSSRLPPFGQVA